MWMKTWFISFSACPSTMSLWLQLKTLLGLYVDLPLLNAQTALLGFYNTDLEHPYLINHILLIFKIYVYNRRISKVLCINGLKEMIAEIAKLETSTISVTDANTLVIVLSNGDL